MPLTTDIGLSVSAELTKALDFTTPSDRLDKRWGLHLANGTGAGAADKIWHDRRTLAASATEDLDLAAVLTDAFGATITWARVKGLFISAAAANTNNVIVGAAASNAWAALLNATGTVTLRPGAFMGVGTGSADATCYAVTAGTGDLLKVANSGAGTSVDYDIVIVGASA